MIKHVLVNLTVDGPRDPARDFAISLTGTFGANLTGVAFAHEPVISPSIIVGIPADLIHSMRALGEEAAREAIERFATAVKAAGVPADTRMVTTTYAGAAAFFGRMGRTFDLVVIGQAEPDDDMPGDMVIENALFESGRPIVVVPYIQRDPIKLERVMVCWDGSRAAARAVGDALPLLARSKQIDAVTVKDKDGPDEPPATAADCVAHLTRHGLNAKVERLIGSDIDVADMLLSYAADSGADFMVMGGYSHSKLREVILGGVTRAILASMTIPVLMSH